MLVHGWESARDRTLPHAQVLHAIGFHVLTIDVRGHGANGPEALPLSVGEFAADARAGRRLAAGRPEVSRVGAAGPLDGRRGLARRQRPTNPDVAAVVAVATPADPARLTRQTFRLANLPIPGLIAWPLAWLTTLVYLRPRGHTIASVSATRAVRDIAAPVLLAHGSDDGVVPVTDLDRLAAARRAARPARRHRDDRRRGRPPLVAVRVPRVPGRHRPVPGHAAWAGRSSPDEAAAIAEAVDARRLPDPERLTTLDEEPGGLRSLTRLVRRHGHPSSRSASRPIHDP